VQERALVEVVAADPEVADLRPCEGFHSGPLPDDYFCKFAIGESLMSVTLRTTPDDRNEKDQGDWKSLLTEMDQLKSMTPVPIAAGSPAQ